MSKAKLLGIANWKTLVVGVLGALLNWVNDAFNLGFTPSVINTIIILIMGFVAKDSDTTGVGVKAVKG